MCHSVYVVLMGRLGRCVYGCVHVVVGECVVNGTGMLVSVWMCTCHCE